SIRDSTRFMKTSITDDNRLINTVVWQPQKPAHDKSATSTQMIQGATKLSILLETEHRRESRRQTQYNRSSSSPGYLRVPPEDRSFLCFGRPEIGRASCRERE